MFHGGGDVFPFNMTNRFDIPVKLNNTGFDIAQTTPVSISQEQGTISQLGRVFPKQAERLGAIKESIKQKDIRPLARSFGEQVKEMRTPEGLVSAALGIGLTAPINVAADTALSKLISAVKSAKPVRGEITKLQSLERAKRVGAGAGVLEKVEGEKAFMQARGKLKGELVPEKPRF